ncbi:MAG: T9SS type A sorting domain-containing protein [Clostridia bacterium]|nr:T9SS type A sorting domain-containing protein [Clostridia bacterium]
MRPLQLFFFYTLLYSTTFFSLSAKAQQDAARPDLSADAVITAQVSPAISPLPSVVRESSGLIFFDGMYWTLNDSGNLPCLYTLDANDGHLLRTVCLAGISNIDWEELTQDQDHLYIGDFGNNRGTRKDLRIFKIYKKDIPAGDNATVSSFDTIMFSYANQEDFGKRTQQHNFDCEAMIAFNDSLFLFTKNWENQRTVLYAMPAQAGNYKLQPRGSFDAGGLITGAAMSTNQQTLALIGYVDYESFAWIFSGVQGSDFFSTPRVRINFPDLVFVQTEAICFVASDSVAFSCEESAEFPSIFGLNIDKLLADSPIEISGFQAGDIVIAGMPTVVSHKLEFDIVHLPQPEFTVELRSTRWKILFEETFVKENDANKLPITIKTKDLEPGIYFLRILSGDHHLVKKIIVQH